jgi:hypothetical protein
MVPLDLGVDQFGAVGSNADIMLLDLRQRKSCAPPNCTRRITAMGGTRPRCLAVAGAARKVVVEVL